MSFSDKLALCCESTQEEMRYEGSEGKAPPITTSFVRKQGSYEGEGRGWIARERTIIARTKQHLVRSYSAKERVGELEELLGPEDVDVDFRRILKARDERGRKGF